MGFVDEKMFQTIECAW